ncbi:hypothetical protein [Rubrivirga sp.]|uniref:hypothetical protein n=1 Tax=Rubrivirga sp. TaxID=1885344 RepID=UPI003B52E9CD
MTDVFAPERQALSALADAARAQLLALREGTPDTFEAAAAQTLDAVADLDRRRADRERRVAAPDAPPVGPEARAALHASAQEARLACDELELALHHAAALGRDLIGAWQQATAPAAALVYTARGAVGASGSAGRIHQTG